MLVGGRQEDINDTLHNQQVEFRSQCWRRTHKFRQNGSGSTIVKRNHNLRDDDVIKSLDALRKMQPEYPPSLFSRRRAAFMASVATTMLAAGSTVASSTAAGNAESIFAVMTTLDKIIFGIELFFATVFLGAIAGTAYINRDVLKNLLFPGSPTAIRTTQQVRATFPLSTASEVSTGTTTATLTLLPEETPSQNQPVSTGANNAATPQPTSKPGYHYGQTGTPGPKH